MIYFNKNINCSFSDNNIGEMYEIEYFTILDSGRCNSELIKKAIYYYKKSLKLNRCTRVYLNLYNITKNIYFLKLGCDENNIDCLYEYGKLQLKNKNILLGIKYLKKTNRKNSIFMLGKYYYRNNNYFLTTIYFEKYINFKYYNKNIYIYCFEKLIQIYIIFNKKKALEYCNKLLIKFNCIIKKFYYFIRYQYLIQINIYENINIINNVKNFLLSVSTSVIFNDKFMNKINANILEKYFF